MNIIAWMFRFAPGRLIVGIGLIILGLVGMDVPELRSNGEVAVVSMLHYFGFWPYVLFSLLGVLLVTWSYTAAKKWRGR